MCFGPQFPKNNTRSAFYGLLQCKVYLLFFHNFRTKWLLIPYFWSIPIFPFLTSVCSCNLRHINYQCLSQCKLNLTQGSQHSQHPKNEPKIARPSEARWKLLSNFETDDSSFKGERNRVD